MEVKKLSASLSASRVKLRCLKTGVSIKFDTLNVTISRTNAEKLYDLLGAKL